MAHNCLEHFTTCIECGCVLMGGRSSQSAAKHHQMHERHRDQHNVAWRRLDDLEDHIAAAPAQPKPCHNFDLTLADFGVPATVTALTVTCKTCGQRKVFHA